MKWVFYIAIFCLFISVALAIYFSRNHDDDFD
jgi:hypothetical protein